MNANDLLQLSGRALESIFNHTDRYWGITGAGLQATFSGYEHTALNNVLVDSPALGGPLFRSLLEGDLRPRCPFQIIVFPDAFESVGSVFKQLPITEVTEFVYMVRSSEVTVQEPTVNPAHFYCATEVSHIDKHVQLLSETFHIPYDLCRAANNDALLKAPDVVIFLAESEGKVCGTLTMVQHGKVAGIWSMAVTKEVQQQGIGYGLLQHAMEDMHARGVHDFYTGTLPAAQKVFLMAGFEVHLTTKLYLHE